MREFIQYIGLGMSRVINGSWPHDLPMNGVGGVFEYYDSLYTNLENLARDLQIGIYKERVYCSYFINK